jgi:rhamnogalacturonan endolyase
MIKKLILLSLATMMATPMVMAQKLSDDHQTIGLWHMEDLRDDDSVTTKRGHDLTYSRGTHSRPTIVANGKYGKALSFDGGGIVTATAAWGAYDSVKIDLWVKIDTDLKYNQLIATAPSAFELYYKGLAKELTWLIRSAGNKYLGHAAIKIGALDEQWIHVVATYNAKNQNVISLTVNGGTPATSTSKDPHMGQQKGDIFLGGLPGIGKNKNSLKGMLDEVKITVPSILPDTAAPTPRPATWATAPSMAQHFSDLTNVWFDKVADGTVALNGYLREDNETDAELIDYLFDGNYFSREIIIHYLRDERGVSKKSIASSVVKKLKDPKKKEDAVMILGQLGIAATATLPALKTVLQDGKNSIDLRLKVIAAMEQIDYNSVPLSSWLIGLDSAASANMAFTSRSYVNRAMDVFEDAGESSIAILVKGLGSSDAIKRRRCVTTLGRVLSGFDSDVFYIPGKTVSDFSSHIKGVQSALRPLLKDPKAYVAFEAAKVLIMLDPADKAAVSVDKSYKRSLDSGVTKKAKIIDNGKDVVLDNGIVKVSINKQNARGTLSRYDNPKEEPAWWYFIYNNNLGGPKNPNYIYWHGLGKSKYSVIRNDENYVEISVISPGESKRPLNVDFRYVLRKGDSGFYFYVLAKKPANTPDFVNVYFSMNWLMDRQYDYRYMHDKLQGPMHLSGGVGCRPFWMRTDRVRTEDGRIIAKHAWTGNELHENLFGMCSSNKGYWLIIPDFSAIGAILPRKHNTFSHIGNHDTTKPWNPRLGVQLETVNWGRGGILMKSGWEKVYGPFMVYANAGENSAEMWTKARAKAEVEKDKWPYSWAESSRYPDSASRGVVTGKLSLAGGGGTPKGAWVVLAVPDRDRLDEKGNNKYDPKGNFRYLYGKGEHQTHSGKYFYFTRTDKNGDFTIDDIIPDTYTLYAWSDGVLGEYRQDNVVVNAGKMNMGTVSWKPIKYGKMLWEIGIPDRSGKEFVGGKHFRGHEMPTRYREFFPVDKTFTIGVSKESEDWFYYHPHKNMFWEDTIESAENYGEVIQKISFNLAAPVTGTAYLTITTANNHMNDLKLTVNGYSKTESYDLGSGAGRRAGMYGFYDNKVFTFDSSILKVGANEITLTVVSDKDNPEKNRYQDHFIYDYLRLEVSDKAVTFDPHVTVVPLGPQTPVAH